MFVVSLLRGREEDEEEVEEVDLGMSTTVAAGSFTVGS